MKLYIPLPEVNYQPALDTLSRLKGIETLLRLARAGADRLPLDTLSRLKGIETIGALNLAVELDYFLWIHFPV